MMPRKLQYAVFRASLTFQQKFTLAVNISKITSCKQIFEYGLHILHLAEYNNIMQTNYILKNLKSCPQNTTPHPSVKCGLFFRRQKNE